MSNEFRDEFDMDFDERDELDEETSLEDEMDEIIPDASSESKTTESRREKFIRIAEGRTNKIINQIDLLSNCSNKSSYEYTYEDVENIFGAIRDALNTAESKFKTQSKDRPKFELGNK